jgi:hypothetical protein
MSAGQALRAARAAGIHLEVEGDDLLLEAPAPSTRPPTASNEPGRRTCHFKGYALRSAAHYSPINSTQALTGLTRAFKCAVDPCLADFNRKRPDRPQHPVLW